MKRCLFRWHRHYAQDLIYGRRHQCSSFISEAPFPFIQILGIMTEFSGIGKNTPRLVIIKCMEIMELLLTSHPIRRFHIPSNGYYRNLEVSLMFLTQMFGQSITSCNKFSFCGLDPWNLSGSVTSVTCRWLLEACTAFSNVLITTCCVIALFNQTNLLSNIKFIGHLQLR